MTTTLKVTGGTFQIILVFKEVTVSRCIVIQYLVGIEWNISIIVEHVEQKPPKNLTREKARGKVKKNLLRLPLSTRNTWRPVLQLIFQTTKTQTTCHVSNPQQQEQQQQQQRRQLYPEKKLKSSFSKFYFIFTFL